MAAIVEKIYDSVNDYAGSASTPGGDRLTAMVTTNSETGRDPSRQSCDRPLGRESFSRAGPSRNSGRISDIDITQQDKFELEKLYEAAPELRVFKNPQEVGRGAFSAVFVAHPKNREDIKVVLKKIKRTSHILNAVNEVKFLLKLGGRHNIPELFCHVRVRDAVVLVMPYLQADDFNVCIRDLEVHEIRLYLQKLFEALAHVHTNGIIHRDVKPGNFLFNRRTKQCMLIDFGLAQYQAGKGESSESDESGEESPDGKKPFSKGFRKVITSDTESSSESEGDSGFETSLRDRLLADDAVKSSQVLDYLQEQSREEKKKKKEENRAVNGKKKVSKKPAVFVPSFDQFLEKKRGLLMRKNPRVDEKRHTAFLKRFTYAKPNIDRNSTNHARKSDAYTFLDGENCACLGEDWICQICEEQVQMRAPRGGTPGFRAPEVLLKSQSQTTAIDVWSAGIILLTMLSKQYPFFTAQDDAESLVEIAGIFGTDMIRKMGKNSCAKVVTFDPTAPPRPPLQLRGLSLLMRRAPGLTFTPEEPRCDFCRIAVHVEGHGPRCLCEPDWKRRRLVQLADRNSDQTVHKFKKKIEEKTAKTSVEAVVVKEEDFPEEAYDLLSALLRVDPADRLTAEDALKHKFLSEG